MTNLVSKFAFLLFSAAVALVSFQAGRKEVQLAWTEERERLLQEQIKILKAKDNEIAKLQTSISVLNSSAVRVRNKDTELQRKLQAELGNCGRFRSALERCSSTLARCADHAVRDRKIIEFCSIQLK